MTPFETEVEKLDATAHRVALGVECEKNLQIQAIECLMADGSDYLEIAETYVWMIVEVKNDRVRQCQLEVTLDGDNWKQLNTDQMEKNIDEIIKGVKKFTEEVEFTDSFPSL